MLEDTPDKVKMGLRKGTRVIGALFVGATLTYFAVYFWFSAVEPVFPVWLAFAYLAVAGGLTAVTLWNSAYRLNPRILAFVQSLSGRLRDAQYVPYGTRMRGLLLAFDNGLVMTVQQNTLAFRLFLAADGTVLKPAVGELLALLRTYRGAKRRGMASSRKGDAWMKAELDRVRGVLGSRWGMVILFEKPASGGPDPSAGKWTSVGLFFTPKWVQRGEAVRAAVDDIERVLEQARTGLALR
jgi:hypothetical protein